MAVTLFVVVIVSVLRSTGCVPLFAFEAFCCRSDQRCCFCRSVVVVGECTRRKGLQKSETASRHGGADFLDALKQRLRRGAQQRLQQNAGRSTCHQINLCVRNLRAEARPKRLWPKTDISHTPCRRRSAGSHRRDQRVQVLRALHPLLHTTTK